MGQVYIWNKLGLSLSPAHIRNQVANPQQVSQLHGTDDKAVGDRNQASSYTKFGFRWHFQVKEKVWIPLASASHFLSFFFCHRMHGGAVPPFFSTCVAASIRNCVPSLSPENLKCNRRSPSPRLAAAVVHPRLPNNTYVRRYVRRIN